VSIIAWHGAVVCGGYDYEARVWQGPIGPVVWFLVPSFFALSGFLVMGSLQRNDLLSFLALRGLRIFPALAVELVLSAFIIGGLLTTLPVTAYFTDTRFFDYFGNLIGIVRYELPGVFQTMPTPAVNLQLWTIPYEFDCYIVLSCLALLGLHRRPGVLLGLVVGLGVAFALHSAATGDLGARRMPMPGPALVFSFLCGAALYALRDRVPFKGSLFVAALVLSWLSLRSLEFHYAAALPVAYVTIYLGLLDPRRLFVLKGADYSYGLYLYGFPVQQTIAYLFPDTRTWAINVLLSLAVASCFAAFSWHVIESRVLANRRTVLGFLAKINRTDLVAKTAT